MADRQSLCLIWFCYFDNVYWMSFCTQDIVTYNGNNIHRRKNLFLDCVGLKKFFKKNFLWYKGGILYCIKKDKNMRLGYTFLRVCEC